MGGPLRDFTIAHPIMMACFYNHVPFFINSGYTQDSRGLFGPSGADQRKAQDGCQNGQQRLDTLTGRPLRNRNQAINL